MREGDSEPVGRRSLGDSEPVGRRSLVGLPAGAIKAEPCVARPPGAILSTFEATPRARPASPSVSPSMSLSPADPLWPVLRADALADARQGRLSRLHVLREAGLDEDANAPLLDAMRAGSGGAGLRLRLPAGPSCFVSFAQAAAGSVVELVLDAGSTAFPEFPYDRPSVVCALLEAGTRMPRLRALEIPLGPVPPAAAAAFLRAHGDGLREVRLLSYGSDAGAVRQARAIGPALRELHSLEALYLSGRLWRAAGRDPVGNPLLPLPAGLRRMNAVLGFIPADALPPRLESLALQPRHMIHPDWPHDDPQAEADTERLLAVAPPTLRAMTCLRDDLHTLGPEHAARLHCARLPMNDPEGMRAGLRRLLRGDFPALRNLIDPASLDADCAELASLIAGRAWDGLVLNGSMPARPEERPAGRTPRSTNEVGASAVMTIAPQGDGERSDARARTSILRRIARARRGMGNSPCALGVPQTPSPCALGVPRPAFVGPGAGRLRAHLVHAFGDLVQRAQQALVHIGPVIGGEGRAGEQGPCRPEQRLQAASFTSLGGEPSAWRGPKRQGVCGDIGGALDPFAGRSFGSPGPRRGPPLGVTRNAVAPLGVAPSVEGRRRALNDGADGVGHPCRGGDKERAPARGGGVLRDHIRQDAAEAVEAGQLVHVGAGLVAALDAAEQVVARGLRRAVDHVGDVQDVPDVVRIDAADLHGPIHDGGPRGVDQLHQRVMVHLRAGPEGRPGQVRGVRLLALQASLGQLGAGLREGERGRVDAAQGVRVQRLAGVRMGGGRALDQGQVKHGPDVKRRPAAEIKGRALRDGFQRDRAHAHGSALLHLGTGTVRGQRSERRLRG